jgi:hypothetical protein
MWPVFGILGLYFWWMLLHTDYEAVGLKGMRRQQEAAAADNGRTVAVAPAAPEEPAPILTVEDPALAAYNARLAELAAKGPKTWRAREKVVVRREQ